MKKHKRLLAAFLGMTMAVSMLAGCGKTSDGDKQAGKTDSTVKSSTAAGSKMSTAATAPVDVTVAIWGADDGLSDSNDPILKKLEEKTGVHLIPQNITWDDFEQKVQLWSTNGQLPDIFVGDFVGKSFFGNWVEQGIIRALPDDLSAYPNLTEYLKMERAQAAKKDGKYYMIPRSTYKDISYSVLDRNVAYRWDLAQKAGVTKEPETYEEFADMIKKIIAADPEKKHISGMTQIIPNLLAGFVLPYGGIVEKKWVNVNDKFMPSYFANKEGLVKALELARKFYTEGVVEKDIALAKLETSKEKFLKGESAALVFAWAGPAGLYSNMAKDYEQIYPDRKFIDDIKIAKLYPGYDGKKNYFVDTEAWSESYFSSNVDDGKMAAICKLYDYLFSEEGKRLVFCGFEGEDYDVKDGKVVMKDGVDIANKYQFTNNNSSVNALGMWNPSSWDMTFPSAIPMEYRQLSEDRHMDAVNNGTLPKYYDNVLFLSTPLKNEFTYNTNDDLMQIMMGTEPVSEMVDKLFENYENNGLSAMIDEVNQAAKDQGITK